MSEIIHRDEDSAVHLDGRTFEGGGQLVRIAIALSALTGQAVNIEHIRGNRSGKKGLKGSHLAAINALAELSRSTVSGVEVGSSSLSFCPQRSMITKQENLPDENFISPDITIRLPTAGSIFLVFQALYPYLLYAGAASPTCESPIRLTISGGTNVSFSPSFDYVAQVLIPNLARVGLPPLTVDLDKRGWATGPFSLGKATFVIDLLDCGEDSRPQFPPINIDQCGRGEVTKIDITILAPDEPLTNKPLRSMRKNGSKYSVSAKRGAHGEGKDTDRPPDSPGTIRQFIESEVFRSLRKGLRGLPSCVFETIDSVPTPDPLSVYDHTVPLNIYATETTRHYSQIYILIVAHTSTGFKIGHDTLYGAEKDPSVARQTGRRCRSEPVDGIGVAKSLVQRCVDGFLQELYDPNSQGAGTGGMGLHQPCVDEYMRDQLVVFEALGRGHETRKDDHGEDQRYWSLHTKTAQWVCQEILGRGR